MNEQEIMIARRVSLQEIAFTCAICGKNSTVWQLPGAAPIYCRPGPGERSSACQREATRRRVAAHRAKEGQS